MDSTIVSWLSLLISFLALSGTIYQYSKNNERARLGRKEKRLSPFYIEIFRFCQSYRDGNFNPKDITALKLKAHELGLYKWRNRFSSLIEDVEKHAHLMSKGSYDKNNDYSLSEETITLGKKIQAEILKMDNDARLEEIDLRFY